MLLLCFYAPAVMYSLVTVAAGCRIQVTQGYTRGTTVLRDVEVDRALSGYAFSDGVDNSMLTLPQSSVKAGAEGSVIH